jgi:hypothetical protein
MSRTCSPHSGKPYGIKRICQVRGYPRSSFYAQGACHTGERPQRLPSLTYPGDFCTLQAKAAHESLLAKEKGIDFRM